MLLIISRNKRLASALSDTFYYMSILSYPATPKEALSEISINYRAIVIIDPQSFPDISDYIERLKSLVKEIPLFAISDTEITDLNKSFCEIFKKNCSSPKIAARIMEVCTSLGKERLGTYKLAGFDASSDRVGVFYFYSKPPLTKTEAMILRYLICSYPNPQNSEQILSHAFRHSRIPEAATIRTHISLINKKLEKISGRRIIELSPHMGYYISTPELAEKRKIM